MKTLIKEIKENAWIIPTGIVALYILTAIIIATIEHIQFYVNL